MNAEEQRRSWNWARERVKLGVRDAAPFSDTAAFWRTVSQMATIGMAAIMFGALLYFTQALVMPVLAALVVSMTLGPLVQRVAPRAPSWVSALIIVILMGVSLYLAIISLSKPAADLFHRSSEIGTAVKDKLQIFETPLAALRELRSAMPGSAATGTPGTIAVETSQTTMITGALSLVTPAVSEFLLFFATLFFFLIGRKGLRRSIVNMFRTREGRLRALRIVNDIEHNLSTYLVTVTLINFAVGLFTFVSTYLIGLPTPLLWAAMAFVLNYIPYLGAGVMYVVLFVVGLLSFPSLLWALAAPGVQAVFSFFEGQILTPNIIGRRFFMQPLMVFLSLAFWAWLWGPIGAFLATPILLMCTVALNHLYPSGEHTTTLPG